MRRYLFCPIPCPQHHRQPIQRESYLGTECLLSLAGRLLVKQAEGRPAVGVRTPFRRKTSPWPRDVNSTHRHLLWWGRRVLCHEALAELKTKGRQTIDEKPRQLMGNRYAFIHRPKELCGVLTEVLGDGTPTACNLLADAVTVFDAVDHIFEDNGLAPIQLYVMGRSLGSAAAIETALHAGEQLAGLILESGFTDTFALLARLGVQIQRADEACDGFGNPVKMARISTRTLVIHGQADVLIPASDGQELYRRRAAPDKQLVLIPGGGHDNLMMVGVAQYFEAIRTFVHRRCSENNSNSKRVRSHYLRDFTRETHIKTQSYS